jgi:hypothetical protein
LLIKKRVLPLFPERGHRVCNRFIETAVQRAEFICRNVGAAAPFNGLYVLVAVKLASPVDDANLQRPFSPPPPFRAFRCSQAEFIGSGANDALSWV